MVVTDKAVYYQKVYAYEKRYFVILWAICGVVCDTILNTF